MSSKKKLIIIMFLVFVLFLILFIRYRLVYKNSTGENHIIENGINYNIKIDYPILKDKDFDKKIESFIYEEIRIFKEEIKNLDKEKNNELNIQYYLGDNNKNLYSIYFTVNKFTGNTNYIKKDINYYFDYKNKKEINLGNIFTDMETSLAQLADISKNKLISKYSNSLYRKNLIKNGINLDIDDIKYIIFNKNNISIIFPPYQIAEWSNGTLIINIDYKDINAYLKKDFRINIEYEKDEIDNDIDTRNLLDLKNKKLIAITFDDGPSKYTSKLLDGLEKRNAKVTFFVVGSRVEQYSDIILRAYNDGHTIGNHTYDHKNLFNLNDNQILSEINDTNLEIKNLIGIEPKFLRPPYGNFNSHIMNLTNMSFVLWNVDTEDWYTKNADLIYNSIINNAKEGNIILLHDTYAASVDAVLKAIDTLQNKGYAFVSLDELEKMELINNQSKYIYSFNEN